MEFITPLHCYDKKNPSKNKDKCIIFLYIIMNIWTSMLNNGIIKLQDYNVSSPQKLKQIKKSLPPKKYPSKIT